MAILIAVSVAASVSTVIVAAPAATSTIVVSVVIAIGVVIIRVGVAIVIVRIDVGIVVIGVDIGIVIVRIDVGVIVIRIDVGIVVRVGIGVIVAPELGQGGHILRGWRRDVGDRERTTRFAFPDDLDRVAYIERPALDHGGFHGDGLTVDGPHVPVHTFHDSRVCRRNGLDFSTANGGCARAARAQEHGG